MNKYFEQRAIAIVQTNINQTEITSYRKLVLIEMDKMGASDNEKQLIHDATIRNAIRNNRKPGDVAWAILQ